MSIERGPYQVIVKSNFFHFFAKTIFSKKFKHTVGLVLKNAIIGENFVGESQGVVLLRWFFAQKKAIFNR
jgi:hypothetical protein